MMTGRKVPREEEIWTEDKDQHLRVGIHQEDREVLTGEGEVLVLRATRLGIGVRNVQEERDVQRGGKK